MNIKLKPIAQSISVLLLSSASIALSANTPVIASGQQKAEQRIKLIELDKKDSLNQQQAVFQFLVEQNQNLAIKAPLSQLTFQKTKESLSAKHYYFEQQINGISVWRSEVIVSVFNDGKARVFDTTVAVSQLKNNKNNSLNNKVVLTEENALSKSWNNLQSSGVLLAKPTVKLAYVSLGKALKLAYITHIYTNAPQGEWQQIIDANSGEQLSVKRTDLPTFKNANADAPTGKWQFAQNSKAKSFDSVMADFSRRSLVNKSEQVAITSKADATALVFDPDPRTTLNDDSLQDNSPASAFESAYQSVTLQDVTLDNGVYRLTGPWVTLIDFETGRENSTEAPSTSNSGNWTAKRGETAFNDVMTYYHLDENQRYMQSLGFTGQKGIQELSIEVDANGVDGDDNSHFIPSSNRLAFGHGCVDDNEDVDVILHEYGHAINYSINNNWSGGDTGAMGEGFGDYWAGSYSYSTPNGQSFHPEWVYTWDGHNTCWNGRVMDQTGYTYDPTKTYGAHALVNGELSDELWSTPLFQSLLDLINLGQTREEVDQIVLESQFGLGAGVRMPELATATVQAALALFPNGPHAGVFYDRFKQVSILGDPMSNGVIALSGTGSDNSADPGETLDVTVPLTNSGPFTLTNVSAVMSTTTNGVTLPSTSSSYADIASNTEQNNSQSLQVSLPDNHSCGVPVELSMAVNFSDNGEAANKTLPFVINTGTRTPESASVSPNSSIPDNDSSGVSSSTELWNVGAAIDDNFNVDVDITHTWSGDLTLQLTSPEGTTITLRQNQGGSSDNIVGNFPSDFTPVQSFNAFQGENLSGTWLLKIVDSGPQDVGTLNSWSINAGGFASCSNGTFENRVPTASVATSNLTVDEGDAVTLDATASSDPDNDALTYLWTQTSGSAVTLSGANTSEASFTAPNVSTAVSLVFQLRVADDKGGVSFSTVTVDINNTDGSGLGPDSGSSGGATGVLLLLGLLLRRRRFA